MLNANDKAARFLGFAFASADLLFEVDRSGQIVFALGARRQLTGDLNPNLIGQSWKAIVAPIDHEFMQTLLRQLDKPGRCGPVRLTLRSDSDQPRHASFSACKLDISADHIHCVLSLSGGGAFGAVEADGIMTHENFVRAAPEIVSRAFARQDLAIDLHRRKRISGRPERAGQPDRRSFVGHGLRSAGIVRLACKDGPDAKCGRHRDQAEQHRASGHHLRHWGIFDIGDVPRRSGEWPMTQAVPQARCAVGEVRMKY